MRIITLNIWGGRELEPLLGFVARYAEDTDVFCFQEALDGAFSVASDRPNEKPTNGDVFARISALLPDFDGAFARYEGKPNRGALAMFVRRSLGHEGISNELVISAPADSENERYLTRKLQWTVVPYGGQRLMIANYHGVWDASGKGDTPERMEQGRQVKARLAAHDGPAVLCGDFNLLPDIESYAILAEGMRDLVRESGVTSTRTPLYRSYADATVSQFADYMLVSPALTVKEFAVLPDVASDHAPLRLEIA